EEIELEVTKKWNDNNNEAQKRPEKITLVLTDENGTEYTKDLSLANENKENTNEWEITFTELPKYNTQGNPMQYTLTEKETGSIFYTKENTTIDNKTKTVTNTYEVPDEKVSIEVTKNWVDNSTQAQRRPEKIVLNVKAQNA